MDFKLWPLIKYDIDKWTVPDEVLAGIWAEMELNDRIRTTFYDGNIKTVQEFIDYMKSDLNFVTLVADIEKNKVVALFWLNNFQNGTNQAHFCFPNHYVPGAGELVMDYWRSFRIDRVFVGITPESYKTVKKLMGKLGFTPIGVIPEYCDMIYKGTREGAIISYLLGG